MAGPPSPKSESSSDSGPIGANNANEPEDSRWQRARKPEQRQARRDAILAAAVAHLDEGGLEATTLSAVARTSGVSKANIYRYFESREAILLEVTLDEAAAWVEALTARLAPLAGSGDMPAVASVLANTISARPRLCTLLSSVASVLERNVSTEGIAAFKGRFMAQAHKPILAVHLALPELALERAGELMTYHYLCVAGLWPASNPTPAVAKVLARPEFSSMCLDFETVLQSHALTVLRGLCNS